MIKCQKPKDTPTNQHTYLPTKGRVKKTDYLVTSIKRVGWYLDEITIP